MPSQPQTDPRPDTPQHPIVWTPRDGTPMCMHEITDIHLTNIIDMLTRHLQHQSAAADSVLDMMPGGWNESFMHEDKAQREAKARARIALFEAEATRRGLPGPDDEIPFDTPTRSRAGAVWTTAQRQELRMEEITDTHLLNIIKMLVRAPNPATPVAPFREEAKTRGLNLPS